MPYDATMDDQLFSKVWESDHTRIVVSVFSYNNGPKKLQLSREVATQEGKHNFVKLGRMSKEELE